MATTLAKYRSQIHPRHPEPIPLALMLETVRYSAVLNERFALNVYLASFSASAMISAASLVLLISLTGLLDVHL